MKLSKQLIYSGIFFPALLFSIPPSSWIELEVQKDSVQLSSSSEMLEKGIFYDKFPAYIGGEREDLIPPAVGEHLSGPVDEPVDTAETGDHVGSRSEHEVVGVGQDDLDPERLQVGGRQMPERASGSHRHETRGGECSPGGRDRSGAGSSVVGRLLERGSHPRTQSPTRRSSVGSGRATIMDPQSMDDTPGHKSVTD